MHARNVIAFFVWAWPSGFVTEAVSLGELLHEEALFVVRFLIKKFVTGRCRSEFVPPRICSFGTKTLA